VEIALPWDVLRECAHGEAPPRAGKPWRINFSRVEWQIEVQDNRYVKKCDPQTGQPLPEDNWVWSPQGLIAMHYPEMWGYVFFSAYHGPDAADPPRQVGEEGQVRWQLMQVYYRQKQWQVTHGQYATAPESLALDELRLGPSFALEATPNLFEATLSGPGFTAHVDQHGRLWSTAE
jgi:hypothetical protein